MASISFVSICFLFVFLVRDAQLLSAGPLPAFHWRLGFYWTVLSCCVLAARGLNAASPDEIMTALRSPLVWGVSVGLHFGGSIDLPVAAAGLPFGLGMVGWLVSHSYACPAIARRS